MAGSWGRWLAMLAAGLLGAAWMQGPARAQSSDSAQARRDELAKVLELVRDPDPLQRLANMEEIVASGDALKTQIAIKAAFAGDDPTMRGLAMAAYMASVKTVLFDIHLPPPLQRQYDQVINDPDQKAKFLNDKSYARGIDSLNSVLELDIKNYSIGSNDGTTNINGTAYTSVPFTVIGDRVLITKDLNGLGSCNIQFSPAENLTLTGTMRCNFNSPPLLTITAKLY